jgi:hypothetical protein
LWQCRGSGTFIPDPDPTLFGFPDPHPTVFYPGSESRIRIPDPAKKRGHNKLTVFMQEEVIIEVIFRTKFKFLSLSPFLKGKSLRYIDLININCSYIVVF